MSWMNTLKSYDPTDDLVDEPFTQEMKWKGKDYFIYDNENNSGVPNGIIYVYKTYHKPTGTLSYPIIKLYLNGGEIKEWTDDDQKEFDMEVRDQMFNIKGKNRNHKKFW
jgi:hypothetical protein